LRIWWIGVPIFAALILAAITACGVLFERRRWGVVISFLVVASLALYFMFYEKYLMAALMHRLSQQAWKPRTERT
jgi:hypothetical protein